MNLDDIARMAMNGWPVIPAEPGQKQTYCKWGSVTPSTYNFGELFRGRPVDSNVAVLCDNLVSVVDFDSHGEEPNGVTAYRRIEAAAPQIFYGAIVERTQGKGIHAYYQGIPDTSTYIVDMTVDNVPVKVEVLTGRKLCYCWPSRTEKGEYTIISKANFLNTRPEDLSRLPGIFHKTSQPEKPPAPARQPHDSGDLLVADSGALVDGLIEAYLRGASAGLRHRKAVGLARALAGFDVLTESDVRRGVEMYFNSCGRNPHRGEVEGIVKDAMRHPDLEPPTPWTRIMDDRRYRGLSQTAVETIKRISGGAPIG